MTANWVDILTMDGIAGVDFIQGATVSGAKADLVISDMAPNMNGIDDVDQPKAMYLVELAFAMARQVLKRGGTFVSKVFQGEGVLTQQTRTSSTKLVPPNPRLRDRGREKFI